MISGLNPRSTFVCDASLNAIPVPLEITLSLDLPGYIIHRALFRAGGIPTEDGGGIPTEEDDVHAVEEDVALAAASMVVVKAASLVVVEKALQAVVWAVERAIKTQN
ncbi:hypothetical protein H5410_053373 [Solanum commersonii]|uniref:Uncharacterized protein n=1 Tax=Solanum commersonii TaxID=4109 RepID=A0A9J5X494_SOLCO|nr:hypothetical protein H5410_053373 [Solanum commersonii]